MSDKQDAFVKGIARVFPNAPHRYCDKHFLRDLAKPMRKADSHAKVQMRKKVRGLRAIEREALSQRRESSTQETSAKGLATDERGGAEARQRGRGTVRSPSGQTAARDQSEQEPSGVSAPKDSVAQVVLDYCTVVRGILNDDQGGPLQPPGMRMAEALREVRASLQRNLDLNQPGPGHDQLVRL